ncbi:MULTISPECIES: hypothetical protein [unclassified Corynebacterium]|uniref:hypothetical protein n=1 Tax=unclassified Corynebacterium TaxID=2624378 RepID=UPI002168C0F3|nr:MULTISPECIES: hypothetical protein [unclassified Corynebacterium]MCS4492220.1 hypothetical protein [Corynebacterium sp. ES2715-CONJ3]MCS4532296.1 hypothetical protein [Corynebacterium sp. ES2730-CONJ]
MAKNVMVNFEPELPDSAIQAATPNRKTGYSLVEGVKLIFDRKTFSTWVPGFQIDVAYWMQPKGKYVDGEAISASREGVPALQFVLLEYDDELGNHYSERFELNVRSVLGTHFHANSNTTNGRLNLEKQISKDVQDLNRVLGRISRQL